MKTISFNEDGSMKNDFQTAYTMIEMQMNTILNGIKPDWDRIDHDVKEMEERDVVDAENHDCHRGFEDGCDCDKE